MGFLTDFFAKVFNDNIVLATILISVVPIIELRGAIPFATNTAIWGNLALSNWRAMLFALVGSSLVVPIVALIFMPIINWLKRTKLFGKIALAFENRVKSKAQNMAGGNVTAPQPKQVQIENITSNENAANAENVTSNENAAGNSNKINNSNNTSIANSANNSNATNNANTALSNKTSLLKTNKKSFFKRVLAVFLFVAVPLPLTGVWTGSCVAVFLGLDYLTTCITVIAGNVVAGLIIALILQFFPWLNNYLLWIFLAIVAVILVYEIIMHFVKKAQSKT